MAAQRVKTGPGVPAMMHERIEFAGGEFDPFADPRRAPNGSSSRFRGSELRYAVVSADPGVSNSSISSLRAISMISGARQRAHVSGSTG